MLIRWYLEGQVWDKKNTNELKYIQAEKQPKGTVKSVFDLLEKPKAKRSKKAK